MRRNLLRISAAFCCITITFISVTFAEEAEPCNCNNSIYGEQSYLKNEACAKSVLMFPEGYVWKNGTRDCCRTAISPNPPGCWKSDEHDCSIPNPN